MKKTKHFNISVPELGDVPDITQVSNAISDLEDATAGTLEIMKAEMQGTKITLTSVSRKTKRTGYYEGMSIRFKSPQDIEPNYLKTISVDELGDQELSVAYKVNRNEYIDIVYEGNKFTAYPVVVQKTDSVSNNSSVLVGTAKGVKTAYDKGVEALNKANQAQSSIDKAQYTADGKVSKSGDTMTGVLKFTTDSGNVLSIDTPTGKGAIYTNSYYGHGIAIQNTSTRNFLFIGDNGKTLIDAKNLNTSEKEIVAAINEVKGHFGYEYGSFPLSEANRRECFYHEGTNKVYICVKDYSGEVISHPNSNFEELSFSKHAYDNGFELVRVNPKLWYKKYHNGMLEIFGKTTSAEMKNTYTINFPINFIDTNYMILHQYIGNVPLYSVVVESLYVDHCVLKLNESSGNLGAYYICGMWK